MVDRGSNRGDGTLYPSTLKHFYMVEEKKDTAPVVSKKVELTKATSNVDIDFPELGWGVRAGEVRELPVEESARAIIKANHNIILK